MLMTCGEKMKRAGVTSKMKEGSAGNGPGHNPPRAACLVGEEDVGAVVALDGLVALLAVPPLEEEDEAVHRPAQAVSGEEASARNGSLRRRWRSGNTIAFAHSAGDARKRRRQQNNNKA